MAQRIEIKTVTVAAGTAIATPQKTDLGFRQGYPLQVELQIPPGPSGLVGVALAHSGTKIIPHDESEWLITDSEPVKWPLTDYPTNANWQVWAYNTDQYSHTIQVRMLFNELGPARLIVPIIPAVEQLTETTGIGNEGMESD